MAWEDIEERLKKALTVRISLPAGTIWLPDRQLTIDDWLTSIANTDEELRELNIPRIVFLQNRWPIERLIEWDWDNGFPNSRAIVTMTVGRRAYILFSNWSQYQVIAALEPSDKPALYRAVIGKLLENRSFIPRRPAHVRYRRPDLVPEVVQGSERDSGVKKSRAPHFENFGGLGGPVDWMHPDSIPDERNPPHEQDESWKMFLSDILGGWISRWISPHGDGSSDGSSWEEDMPTSISTAEKGKVFMKYKPSYGDKQREAQRRKKEEQRQPEQTPETAANPAAEMKTNPASASDKKAEDKKGAA